MKLSYLIITVGIIIVFLGGSIIYTNYARKIHNASLINLTITPPWNSYTINIVSTGQHDLYNQNILLTADIQSNNNMQELLRKSNTTVYYNQENNTINNVAINTITWSTYLPSAYRIFIDDVVIPKLGENLLSQNVITINKEIIKGLFSHTLIWTFTGQDSLWTRQSISLSITTYCNPLYYVWRSASCTLGGNITISTPLTSGPILWKIQGKFKTSVLQ